MSGNALYVATWGQGPDVVLLHGLGASSRYWERLAGVSTGFSATAPDLLGFGRSPSPPGAAYDVDCHLAALVPHLPERAVVVAHSTGAILAAALAVREPRRVSSLLLVGLPAYPDTGSARRGVGAHGLLARLTVEGRPSARWLCEAMCRFRPLAAALAPWVVRDLPASVAVDGTRHTWASYSRTLLNVVVGHPAADDLLTAAVPVTLVHGRQDRTAPIGLVRDLVARSGETPHPMQLHAVDGDHHLAVHQPETLAAALAAALAGGGSAP